MPRTTKDIAWSRSDKIGAATFVLAVVALVASMTVPEFRIFVGLDPKPDKQAVATKPPTPESGSTAQKAPPQAPPQQDSHDTYSATNNGAGPVFEKVQGPVTINPPHK